MAVKERMKPRGPKAANWTPPTQSGSTTNAATGTGFSTSSARPPAVKALPLIGHWPARKQYWAAGGALIAAVALALGALALSWNTQRQTDAVHEQSEQMMDAAQSMKSSALNLARGQADAAPALAAARQEWTESGGQLAFGPLASQAGPDGQTPGAGLGEIWRSTEAQARAFESAAATATGWAAGVDRAQQQSMKLRQALSGLAAQAGAGGAVVQSLVNSASALADRQSDAISQMSQKGIGAGNQLNLASRDSAAIEQNLAAASDAGGANPGLRQAIEQARPAARLMGQALSQLTQAAPNASNAQAAFEALQDAPASLSQALSRFDPALKEHRKLANWENIAAAVFALAALGALAMLASIHSRETWAQSRVARAEQREAQAQIGRLLDEIGGLASGDLTARATGGGDSTDAIAQFVNFAIEQLATLAGQIQHAAGDMGEATDRAQTALAQLGGVNHAQAASARNASVSAKKLSAAIQETALAMAGSENIAQRTQELSREGVIAVSESSRGMESIADSVEETAKRMRRLNEGSRQISQILDLITEIGEQTSVLALNATVQANKAGAAGQGFRVVADAVQKLSERAARATSQIAILVKSAQSDIQGAFDATVRAAEHTERGQETSRTTRLVFERLAQNGVELAQVVEKNHENIDQGAKLAAELQRATDILISTVGESDLAWSQAGEDLNQIGREREKLLRSVEGLKIERD